MQSIETQREGYLELMELCLPDDQKQKVKPFIDSLKDYNGHDDYMTTLNFVMSQLNEQLAVYYWIMSLDWKQEIPVLASKITNTLKENFNETVSLPEADSFGDNKQVNVSTKHVFVQYDQSLQEAGFQLGFIDTDGDEYVIFIHRSKDAEKAREAVQKIGYRYLDHTSPKVRNEDV